MRQPPVRSLPVLRRDLPPRRLPRHPRRSHRRQRRPRNRHRPSRPCSPPSPPPPSARSTPGPSAATPAPTGHAAHAGPIPATPAATAAPASTASPSPASPATTARDPRIGQPLCPDCYDYDTHAVWNHAAGELWRRTKQDIERQLAHLARRRGLPFVPIPGGNGHPRWVPPIRVSHGKAAEFQARGAVHFHVLLRLDGIDPGDLDAVVPPPAGITVADLDDAIHHAARAIAFTTATAPRPSRTDGSSNGAHQIDVRVITMRGGNSVTDAMVARYLAKYSTKGTEITGHASARITDDTIDLYADPDGSHAERLIDACWTLGRQPDYHGLRRWAHMLGFGGHFLTKGRRYSVTFGTLRERPHLLPPW